MCWLDPSLKTLMNHPKGVFCSLPTFFSQYDDFIHSFYYFIQH